MKIIFPMAGLGSRFAKVADKNSEYLKPKPFINVKGFPMIRWATGSLPFFEHAGQKVTGNLRVTPKDVAFIILKEHNDAYQMEKQLKEIYSDDITVIVIDKLTRGASETVLKAKDFINPEEDLLLSDTDHFFDGRGFADLIANKDADTAGIIPVFRARNDGIPKWSYTLTKPDRNHISQVAEKSRELMEKGAYANIGAYYFSKGKYFIAEAEKAIERNERAGDPVKGEFYIAPLYQKLLDQGMKLQAAVIPEMWGLGTPEDLEFFLANCPINKPSF
jgi:NDP-sugar pyrophosphorylase family protein